MKPLKTYLFETKLCNLYEGLLDVEDTIVNDDDLYKSIANSEEFTKHWDTGSKYDYKNDTLISKDDVDVRKVCEPIYKFLPKVKCLECDILRDYRAEIDDKNTPKTIKVVIAKFVSCSSMKNIKLESTSKHKYRDYSGTIDFLGMQDVHFENCEFNCDKLGFYSTKYIFNKCRINTKIFKYYSSRAFDDFKNLFNSMLDPSHTIMVHDVKKGGDIERKCNNITKINATINNKRYQPIKDRSILKFKNNINLMKLLGLDGCTVTERILFEDNNIYYEFVNELYRPSQNEISSSEIFYSENETIDGWKLYAYKKY